MKAKSRRVLKTVLLPAVLILRLFPGSAAAAEKRAGNTLVLRMKTGKIFRGELLAVKEDLLILLDLSSSAGLEIAIGDVSKVQIEKRSKFLGGVGLGFLIGAAGGTLLGLASGDDTHGLIRFTAWDKASLGAVAFGILGIPIGGIVGSAGGIDESIDIDALPPASRAAVPARLKEYARSAGDDGGKLPVHPAPAVEKKIRPVQAEVPGKMSRVHLTVFPGYFRSPCAGQIGDVLKGNGFDSPWATKDPVILIGEARIEYSLSRAFALGVSYGPLGRRSVIGGRSVYGRDGQARFPASITITGTGSGKAFFLTGSYFPLPDAFSKKWTLKLTAGIGYVDAGVTYSIGEDPYWYVLWDSTNVSYQSVTKTVSGKSPAALLAGELIHFFNPRLSLGLFADFSYACVAIGGFAFDFPYVFFESRYEHRHDSLRIDVPAKTANFGGWGIGLSFGYHF